ncbi:MAG: hypothetical protein MUF21_04785 [Gemmatimonadaceae bacterium]|jgi:hypothetical protein|nr:hypothetical protein [Gemmatimonadaceae bacterium]MCU0625791.1 hypothetical protein [Gemmatimonadaceae bacterium]
MRSFRGDPRSPFLAPRGVATDGQVLVVADTGQNRVFVWHTMPDGETAPADAVLGQPDVTATGRNGGGPAGRGTLHYPSGVWTDGRRLAVADAWNHRVLLWHDLPRATGAPADVVLGQGDGAGARPNRRGVGSAAAADRLYWPYGVCGEGDALWVADTGNRRVLRWNAWPTHDGAPADAVVGQRTLDARDYDLAGTCWPYAARPTPSGGLLVTDVGGFRVLAWDDANLACAGGSPSVIFGQPTLDANLQNRGALRPSAGSLNWCYDAVPTPDGAILIADTGNCRLLGWASMPTESGAEATRLYGQTHFEAIGEVAHPDLVPDGAYWPFALALAGDILCVADTGNHRVLIGAPSDVRVPALASV